MTPIDRDILELLENGGDELVFSPAVIAANLDWSHDSIRRHMKGLREQGLVEYYDETRGLYQLSERGRAWLRGDLPTEEIEEK
jgi:predicted ArsR family transcriptional regulator